MFVTLHPKPVWRVSRDKGLPVVLELVHAEMKAPVRLHSDRNIGDRRPVLEVERQTAARRLHPGIQDAARFVTLDRRSAVVRRQIAIGYEPGSPSGRVLIRQLFLLIVLVIVCSRLAICES
jgi:hypothetical protein